MSRTAQGSTLPDEERWDGWVTFAWLLAALTVFASVVLVATMGFIEFPGSYSKSINWPVWGLSIGQSVASLMLAALFSIANAAYKNSCKTMRMMTVMARLSLSNRQKAKQSEKQPTQK